MVTCKTVLHFLSFERHGLIKLAITMRYSSSKPWHSIYHMYKLNSEKQAVRAVS